MTPAEDAYRKAIALRKHHLEGFHVDPDALAEAIALIQRTRTRTPYATSIKHIPVPQEQDEGND